MKDTSIVDTAGSIQGIKNLIDELNQLGTDFYEKGNWLKINEILGKLEWVVIENFSSDANDYYFMKMENEMGLDSSQKTQKTK